MAGEIYKMTEREKKFLADFYFYLFFFFVLMVEKTGFCNGFYLNNYDFFKFEHSLF